jgi:hypothetical protein
MYITVLKLSIIVVCEDAKLLLIIPKLSNVVAKLPTFVAPRTNVAFVVHKSEAEGRDPSTVHHGLGLKEKLT